MNNPSNAERVRKAREAAAMAWQGVEAALGEGNTKRAHANAAGAWRAALWATEALLDEIKATGEELPDDIVKDEEDAWTEATAATENALSEHFNLAVKEALAVACDAPSVISGRHSRDSITAAIAMIEAHDRASETEPDDPDAIPSTLTIDERKDLINTVFNAVLGIDARDADTQMILAMTQYTDFTKDISLAIGSFLWDHWMGEPDSPTEEQTIRLVEALVPFSLTRGDLR